MSLDKTRPCPLTFTVETCCSPQEGVKAIERSCAIKAYTFDNLLIEIAEQLLSRCS